MSTSLPQPTRRFTGPITIDPVTRLEGHLRIEVEVTDGLVSKAHSASTMYRGIEQILVGRDPRDAQHITQRVCGVCTYTHALSATRALEQAIGIEPPVLATHIRRLVLAGQFLHDHIVQFYHLHSLDFFDVERAQYADITQCATLLGARPHNHGGRRLLLEKLQQTQNKIKALFQSKQLGLFSNAYFLGGHPAYSLSPEHNLIGTMHYLDALKIQAKIAKGISTFGGKHPHPQFLLAGGVSCYDALLPDKIREFSALCSEAQEFINTIYLPDVLDLGKAYKELAQQGGSDNYMQTSEFGLSSKQLTDGFFRSGVITERALGTPSTFNPEHIAEHIRHSWYHGITAESPQSTPSTPAYTGLHTDERYSWSKAPRYAGLAMETGPLANILTNYALGHQEVCMATNELLDTIGLHPADLCSTFGRIAARALETTLLANQLPSWIALYQDAAGKAGEKAKLVEECSIPTHAEGVGFTGCPRGSLSHWLRIENGRIANYQMIVPSTWNLGPRCANGLPGPLEAALVGTPVLDPARPVEILRTIHSFDPCLACAVHIIDPLTNRSLCIQAV